jgi:chaperone modulatory protein CbpM
MKNLNQLGLQELCQRCGISEEIIQSFIEEGWILPMDSETSLFDDEDMARIFLIRDLKETFEVNDHAVPIILDLIDQLLSLQAAIKKIKSTQI